jgi:ABC-2 type transport system permease protein
MEAAGPSAAPAERRMPGLADLAELRLRLAWRRMRARGGAAEGVAQLLLFLLALPASVVFAVLIGAGSYRAARAAQGLQASVTIAAILYGLWQTWTAVSLTMNERDAIDLRRLLVYPVPPARLYLLGLGTSIVGDPFALFWLVLLAGMTAGAALARPGAWILLLAAVLAAFAAATVALVALAQELLGRLARSRRWRELAAVAAVVGWLVLVASSTGGARTLRGVLPVLRQARWALYPAALAAEATERLYAGRNLAALPWLLLLAAAAIATGWLAYRIGLATARSGGEAGSVIVARDASRRGWLFPERFGPLFEKEVRYLTRHPAARVYVLILPAVAALLGWKGPALFARAAGAADLVRALPLFGLAAYVHLAFQIFWVNGLGWERGGARTLFLAPVQLEEVLAAKNLALFAYTTAVFALSAGAYVAMTGAPPAWVGLGALALHAGMAPILYGFGNVLGILAPRAAPFGMQRAGSVSPLAALAAMGITSAAMAVFALPVLAALWLDALWLVPVAWAALAAIAAVAWRMALPLAAGLLSRRREQVLVAVCGDEA